MADSTKWTSEEKATLRRLRAEGKTFGQIGYAMKRSRCSVGAMCHRLGLCDQKRAKRRAHTQVAKVRRVRAAATGAAPPLPSKKLPKVPAHDGGSISILDLRPDTCRFPVTDAAPHRFCGAHAPGKGPYCDHHTEWISERYAAQVARMRSAA